MPGLTQTPVSAPAVRCAPSGRPTRASDRRFRRATLELPEHLAEGTDDTARGWFQRLQLDDGDWAITGADGRAPRVIRRVPEKAKGLWLKALESPEVDMRCKAAEAVALAHRRAGPADR